MYNIGLYDINTLTVRGFAILAYKITLLLESVLMGGSFCAHANDNSYFVSVSESVREVP